MIRLNMNVDWIGPKADINPIYPLYIMYTVAAFSPPIGLSYACGPGTATAHWKRMQYN